MVLAHRPDIAPVQGSTRLARALGLGRQPAAQGQRSGRGLDPGLPRLLQQVLFDTADSVVF